MTSLPHLAVELDGHGANPALGGTTDIAVLTRAAAAAEATGFVFATLADSPLPPPGGRLEAGVRAAFLASRTQRIGLAPTLHVTTTEPFHLATQLASLDHAARGRGAWVVGADNSAAALATVGRAPLGPEELRREVADVIEVARRLWDSWADDAVIKDRATGRFLDPDRVHHVNFTGASFTVAGPLITPRPPQGQLVVAGPAGLGVTAQLDIALVTDPADAEQARRDGAPLVFAELEVQLDTEVPATDRLPWPAGGRLRHTGSLEGLVALLQRLAPVVDGVRLHPAELAVDLPVLARLARPRTAAGTLRAALGLPRPHNRFGLRESAA